MTPEEAKDRRREVEAFLKKFRALASQRGCVHFTDRSTMKSYVSLGLNRAGATASLLGLTADDYTRGPTGFYDDDEIPVWEFGLSISGVPAYIKIVILDRRDGIQPVCFSFHKAEFAQTFPLRGLT